MIHEILPVGMLQCNCSIFGDEQTRQAIVIDPGDNLDTIREILDRHQLSVKAIIITHAHIDHIGGAAKLKKLTGAPVYMNENDLELRDQLDMQAGWLGTETPEKPEIDIAARDGDVLELNGNPFQVIHTPGHTQAASASISPPRTSSWLETRSFGTALAARTCPEGTAGRS